MAYILKTDFLKDFPKERTYGQRQGPFKGVCIHNAAGTTTAKNLGIYGNYNSPEVSFHYAVDESEVYHLIPLDWTAWHAGERNGNMNYIAIEITRDLDYDTDRYARAEENAAILTAKLLTDAGLKVSDLTLKRHYDFNGKLCPHRMFEAESGKHPGRTWKQFIALVQTKMGSTPTPAPTPTPTPTPTEGELVWLEQGTVILREPPSIVEVSTKYTIVEKKNGYGRLKSGIGWVKLPD